MIYVFEIILLGLLVFILSRFRPSPTMRINEGLFAIRNVFVNFYAYQTDQGVLLFDTGINPNLAKRELAKVGIVPDDVTHVFLTHTDYDHAGGRTAFPQAELFMSTAEEQMIDGTTPRRGVTHNSRINNYQLLADSETVVIGNTSISLYIAPGHTSGSAIYFIDNRYLVTGDLLRIGRNGNILPFLWLMNMKHQQDIESVKANQGLLDVAEYICTGHTGVKNKLSG
ncbi:MAG: MBL fold metallo-hydrolase [Coriobacteriia bacterium]|nr:MBL fold metallo-hydrolase [Coriobacteriia bacterium]